jgi:ABC-type amino acid transport substrate-binding protein
VSRWFYGFVLGLGLWSLSAASWSGVLERIEATQSLRICIWPDYFGISHRDPKTRQLQGIDIDLGRSLAQSLKVQPVWVDSSFAQLVNDVTTSRCDIAMFAIGITPQRQQHLWFTPPHLSSDVYGITTKSHRRMNHWSDIDQPGTVVAVAKGTLHETVMRQHLKQAQLLVVNQPGAREAAVESGRADVFMTDYPFSQRMLKTTDWARLIAPPTSFNLTPYAWAIKPGDEAWQSRLTEFVHRIKRNGQLKQAAEAHGLLPIALIE